MNISTTIKCYFTTITWHFNKITWHIVQSHDTLIQSHDTLLQPHDTLIQSHDINSFHTNKSPFPDREINGTIVPTCVIINKIKSCKPCQSKTMYKIT